MATDDVHAILKKAATDEAFRLALSKNFDKTVKAHDLTLSVQEKNALKAIDWTKAPLANPGDFKATWVHIYK